MKLTDIDGQVLKQNQAKALQQLVRKLTCVNGCTRQVTVELLEQCGLKTIEDQEKFLRSIIANSTHPSAAHGFNTWLFDKSRNRWVYPTEA